MPASARSVPPARTARCPCSSAPRPASRPASRWARATRASSTRPARRASAPSASCGTVPGWRPHDRSGPGLLAVRPTHTDPCAASGRDLRPAGDRHAGDALSPGRDDRPATEGRAFATGRVRRGISARAAIPARCRPVDHHDDGPDVHRGVGGDHQPGLDEKRGRSVQGRPRFTERSGDETTPSAFAGRGALIIPVSTDFILSAARDWRWIAAAGVTALVLLVTLAALLRKLGRRDLSRTVTTLATVLGLAWSAQGMWDTAVHHYRQDVLVASVLFVVFESMMLARMLQAGRYRTDLERRAKHVRAVWLIAAVMALVVALGEGWAQAPARLAIPLLVAYGWWTDLTAGDDPDKKLTTSLRWTPRRLGLAIGMLEATARDAETIDRDSLRDRMTRLAFRSHHAPAWLNDVLRRPVRLSRLKTLAEDADL